MNVIYMNTYRAPRREIGYKHFTMVAIALFSVSEHTRYALLYMSLNEWLWLYTAHWFGQKNNIAQGAYRKIRSKFTNFSQPFALWCGKTTQRYTTLLHIR